MWCPFEVFFTLSQKIIIQYFLYELNKNYNDNIYLALSITNVP